MEALGLHQALHYGWGLHEEMQRPLVQINILDQSQYVLCVSVVYLAVCMGRR